MEEEKKEKKERLRMERAELDMKEFKEEELCREEYERSCMFEEEDRIERQAFLDEYQRKLEKKRKREEQIEKYRIWHRNKMATIQKNKENKAMQLKHSKEDAVPDDDVKVDEYTLQKFADEELPEEIAVLEVPDLEDEQLQRELESFLCQDGPTEQPTSPAESVKVDLVEVKQQPETSPEEGEDEEKEEKEEKSEKDEKNERDRRKKKRNAAKARSSRMASSPSSSRTRSRSRTRKSQREYDEMKRKYEKMKREEEMRRMKEEMKRIEKDRKKRGSPTRSRSRRRRQ